MKKSQFILAALVFLSSASFAQINTVVLDQGNFISVFDTVLKYPVSVRWTLKLNDINCDQPLKRSNKFIADPQLRNTNFKSDYSHSGYDQGHNFNAADDACQTPELNKHCWYYTNMTPQTPNLNRKVWKALEDYCRRLVRSGDELYISCGSVGNLKTIGPHQVAVPEYCWKTIKHKNGTTETYVMPNIDTVSRHDFLYYRVNILEPNLHPKS